LIVGVIQPQSGRIVLDGKLLFDSRKGIMMPREQRPISDGMGWPMAARHITFR
jgi:ABC-type molybdate transport system ATPase subunit